MRLPRLRKATREQVRAYDEAHRALWDNSDRERKAGIRHETPEYLDLNDRAWEASKPLPGWQQAVVLTGLRLARADRQQRRAEKARRSRPRP